MELNDLIIYVTKYGYFALFFLLWLGIVGMPIPDEVIVMSGGLVASLGILKPVPAFFVTYLGVVTGLTLGYVLGRILGDPVMNYLKQKKNIDHYLVKSHRLIGKYGSYSLLISYFFPVVRHLVPYIVGLGKMPFRKYFLLSYSTGLLWTVIYFIIGYFFGKQIEIIGEVVYKYGMYVLSIGAVTTFLVFLIKKESNKRKNKSGMEQNS